MSPQNTNKMLQKCNGYLGRAKLPQPFLKKNDFLKFCDTDQIKKEQAKAG